MPNLKDIKNRISSVKSTQKITNAMKLVSASKFAKANAAVVSARPYSNSLGEIVSRLFANEDNVVECPLIKQKGNGKILLLLLSTDRGLCGGLNTNNFKVIEKWLLKQKSSGVKVDIILGGRKAIQNKRRFTTAGANIIEAKEKVTDLPNYAKAKNIAEDLINRFIADQYSFVFVGYNKFVSALNQEPTLGQFLPVSLEVEKSNDSSSTDPYLVEPSPQEILETLLKKQLYSFVFQALLESAASEQGARMTAMDSATNNAKEVTKKLTLQYNRARQAAITTELTEIISGAESL